MGVLRIGCFTEEALPRLRLLNLSEGVLPLSNLVSTGRTRSSARPPDRRDCYVSTMSLLQEESSEPQAPRSCRWMGVCREAWQYFAAVCRYCGATLALIPFPVKAFRRPA